MKRWGSSNVVRAALLATGSSGADCEHHVRGARRRARLAGRPVLLADLEAELDGTSQSPADIWLAAVHQAGYAVAAALLMPGSVMAVSLRGTAEHGGSLQALPAADYPTAGNLLHRIVVDLAGRNPARHRRGRTGIASAFGRHSMTRAVVYARYSSDQQREASIAD